MSQKEDLEIKLLEAQIEEIQNNNNISLLRKMTPALSAIVFSVVASVVVVMIGDKVVDKAYMKLESINKAIKQAELKVSQQKANILELKLQESYLLGTANLHDQDIDLHVQIIQNEGIIKSDTVIAKSSTPNVKLETFSVCTGKFSFPDSAPKFNTQNCQPVDESSRQCRTEENVVICEFGPFNISGSFEVGVWLTASVGAKKAIRYISLSKETY